jgi:signal transduction histidine kinase
MAWDFHLHDRLLFPYLYYYMRMFAKIVKNIIPESHLNTITRSERKRLALTIYLGIFWFAILLFYTLADIANNVYYALPAYGLSLICCFAALGLLKKQRYQLAKVLMYVSGVLIIFYVSMADPLEAGAFFLFIPISMCPFATFDFKEAKKIFFLTGIIPILFLVSFLGVIDVDVPMPSAQYIQISFIINFLLCIITSTLILFFLINLNSESEKELTDKEHAVVLKNQELEKINKELDRFVYSVSHDLRSPLSSVLGIINLAKYTGNIEELKEYIHLIDGRIKALDDFIKNITDYSRNVRIEVTQEKVEVRSLAKEVIDSLRFLPGASSIAFQLFIEDEVAIVTDKLRLRIVLNNLVSNAIKYSDALRKKAFVEIGASQLEDELIVYVKDNGIGIDTEWLPKIFDMFTRATEHSSGSGLGLFITKETVEKIGGTMSVESKVGQGSTFSVYLPLSPPRSFS